MEWRIYGFLKSLGFLPNPYDPCVLNLDYKDETYTLVLYLDDSFVDCYNPKQLNYVKQIILLRNTAGACAPMGMYCHIAWDVIWLLATRGCKSGHAQIWRLPFRASKLQTPPICRPDSRPWFLKGCRFAGQIDKDKEVLRISVDARGIVETFITVVVSRLYYWA